MSVVWGNVVYDSARIGASIGTRGTGQEDRAILFKADSFCVDVMIHAGTGGIHLVQGQVLHQAHDTPVRGVRVRLGQDSEGAETDCYGQFSLTNLRGEDLKFLVVGIGEKEVICWLPVCDTWSSE